MEVLTNRAIVRSVIADVTHTIRPTMLVFGLAYDSELWAAVTHQNTYFVESNIDFIEATTVDPSRILYYNYGEITVESSYSMTDTALSTWPLPVGLLEKAPFDVILVAGPDSYNKQCPGRILPLFWTARSLSRAGSVVYVDDSRRALETYCIDRFFSEKAKTAIVAPGGCMRIQI
jgi:hypothetical protein